MQFGDNDLKEWRDEMRAIVEEKRERKVEQTRTKVITHREVKANEQVFNPILQVYSTHDKETEAKPIEKYERNYDILNLEPARNGSPNVLSLDEKPPKATLVPAVREFNIINNDQLPEHYFKNVKVLKQAKAKEKKIDLSRVREYNIINNMYTQDNDLRYENENNQTKTELDQKFRQQRVFNPVKGTFYDDDREKQYQDDLVEKQKLHGKDAHLKLPPSMVYRESVIVDPSREVPEAIKRIDEKNKQRKKRYELKYAIEQEYKDRDIENAETQHKRQLNRLHDGKYVEEFRKGFDIINLEDNQDYQKYLEKFMQRKPHESTWQRVQKAAGVEVELEPQQEEIEHQQQLQRQNRTFGRKSTEQFKGSNIVFGDYDNQNRRTETKPASAAAAVTQTASSLSATGQNYVSEDILREKYHMPVIPRAKLPRLEQKKQEPTVKVNLSKAPQIAQRQYEPVLQLNEPRIEARWVAPPKRIKTGGFAVQA